MSQKRLNTERIISKYFTHYTSFDQLEKEFLIKQPISTECGSLLLLLVLCLIPLSLFNQHFSIPMQLRLDIQVFDLLNKKDISIKQLRKLL